MNELERIEQARNEWEAKQNAKEVFVDSLTGEVVDIGTTAVISMLSRFSNITITRR